MAYCVEYSLNYSADIRMVYTMTVHLNAPTLLSLVPGALFNGALQKAFKRVAWYQGPDFPDNILIAASRVGYI